MKKILLSIFVAILVTAIFSCSKHEVFLINHPDDVTETRSGILGDFGPVGNIFFNDSLTILGPQLDNPYEV